MIKFKNGWVGNNETGKRVDVTVTSRHVASNADWAISLGLVVAGMSYLAYRSFVNGAKCQDAAYMEALSEVGCINQK